MRLKNAVVYDENFDLRELDLCIDGDRIDGLIDRDAAAPGLDLTGCTVMPGWMDIHIHGYGGADTGDADPASIHTMSRRLAQHGVTAFCPTSMTLPAEQLAEIFAAARAGAADAPGACPVGINMEGPYIAPARIGGQNPAFVRPPDAEEFARLQAACGGFVRLVDIAPEQPGGAEFIRQVSPHTTVSMAHTDAAYEQACQAVEAGCRHVTHLYNAMTGLNQRKPGVVGAAFDLAQRYEELHAELICDGKHIHPAALRIAFRQLGETHTVVISDALSAAGTADGRMVSGGLPVEVRDGVAYLENGTIAGSTTNLEQEYRNLLSYGIPRRQIVRSMTENPAKAIRMGDELGTITPGKRANLTVVDGENRVVLTIVSGKIVYDRINQQKI